MTLVPVREFTTAAELRTHYAGVLARMRPPAPRPVRAITPHVEEPEPEPPKIKEPPVFVAQTGMIRAVFLTVARHFDISYSDIVGPVRLKKYAVPRHVAMHLAFKLSRHSKNYIGIQIGGRDHTTVINSLERAQKLMAADETFRAKVDEIEAEIIGGAA